MAGKRVDRTGQKFGRLTMLVRANSEPGRSPRWLARCECGVEKVVKIGDLLRKVYPTKSCGCLGSEVSAQTGRDARLVHGDSHNNITPEYQAWVDLRHRCRNPRAKSYKNYGGRGISVCDRWEHGDGARSGYECFLADMGRRPSPTHSIDRIDNDGNYEPNNCRWATPTQQRLNSRRSRQEGRAECRS